MLNLGDVNFGLGADTNGLEAAVERLKAFGRTVDQVTKAQVDGSQSVVRAYNAQEKAIRSALQASIAMHKEIRAGGGENQAQLLSRTTNAMRALTNAMTSGQLNVVEFTRANDRFKISMNKVKEQLHSVNPPTDRLARFNEMIRNMQASAVLASGPLAGISARLGVLNALTSRTTAGMAALVAGMTATGVGAYKLSSASIKASIEMDRINAGLEAATGSTIGAREEFKFISKTADELGLNIKDISREYSQFAVAARGTSLEGEGARKVFVGMATASRAMNLTSEQSQGAMRALQQMMSKGTVQAEELRGQLGDRIPGAFNIFAKALGVSTRELNAMLKKGEVLSEEALPKFADQLIKTFGGPAAKRAMELSASIERLHNATFRFFVEFDRASNISGKFQKAIDFLTATINKLTNALGLLGNVLMPILGALVGAMVGGRLAGPWGALAGAVAGSTGAFAMFNTVLGKSKEHQDKLNTEVREYIDAANDMGMASKRVTNQLILDAGKRIWALREELIARQTIEENSKDGSWWGTVQRGGVDINSYSAKTAEMKKQLDAQLKLLGELRNAYNLPDPGSGVPKVTVEPNQKWIEAMQDLDLIKQKVADLNALPDYFLQGSKSLDLYKRGLDNAKQIEQFEDKLRRAGATQEEMNEKLAEFKTAIEELDVAEQRFKMVEERARMVDSAFDSMADHFGDLLGDVQSGTKTMAEAFGDMVTYIVKELQKLAIQMTVIDPIKKAFQSGGGLGGIGDFIGSLFGGGNLSIGGLNTHAATGPKPSFPGRANGGNVSAGQSYTVGEEGQERLVMGNRSGRIVPSGGDGVYLEINIIDNAGNNISTRTRNEGGRRSMEIVIDEMVAKQLTTIGTKSNKALTGAGMGIMGR